VRNYFFRLFDATSQFFNVLVFNGEANHSISSDAYRYNRKRLEWAIDLLFSPIERDHCRLSHYAEVRRAEQLVEDSR